ncbi:MAG: hypothetical protein ABI237_13145 [Ginsengibacter sp.]
MATKIYTITLLLFVAMATTFSTCKKGGLGCANTVYNFKVIASTYPDNDSISIGDTIWISADFPKTLLDLNSNSNVGFIGAANLGTALSFDIFTGGSISNPGTKYAANNFNYLLFMGDSVSNPLAERIREYLFKEMDNSYDFKLAIIPKVVGTYAIAISDAANVYTRSDKCTKAAFEIDFANTHQHLYLYQNNRPGYQISGYEEMHMYCFKVY